MARRAKMLAILLMLSVIPFPILAQNASPVTSPGATAEIDGRFDVGGGRMLYLRCIGTGSPTVILESGYTDDHTAWDAVVPDVAQSTRVCAYDRAGTGQSDPAPGTELRTIEDTVDDLHTLLTVAEVNGPYVLAGHSIGGMMNWLYAIQHYPGIAGLVLVDGTPPASQALMNTAAVPEDLRMADYLFTSGQETTPERMDLFASEIVLMQAMLPPSPQVRVPTILLVHEDISAETAGLPAETVAAWEQIWTGLQASQATILGGELIVAEGAGHQIHRQRPDLVIESILRVINAARGTGELAPAPPA